MSNSKDFKIVINCTLCGDKELHVLKDEENSLQCLSCGYSTNDTYNGNVDENEYFQKLDEDLKKWAQESQGQIWIPSVLRLPIGIYYPYDVDGEMKWALAPMVLIPEDEQKNYPIEGTQKFHTKKIDIENQLIFDNFGKGLKQINETLDKQKEMLNVKKN